MLYLGRLAKSWHKLLFLKFHPQGKTKMFYGWEFFLLLLFVVFVVKQNF